jgi:hypothetical protein
LLRRMVSFVVFWGNNEGALFGEIISMSLCWWQYWCVYFVQYMLCIWLML